MTDSGNFNPLPFLRKVSRAAPLPPGHKVGLRSVINHLHDATTCLAN